ncbi:zinc finger protein 841-like isoform X2 [Amyelois transitella]|nr:zinc finger protein 841-like isoform X2 [Amyelois transitella]
MDIPIRTIESEQNYIPTERNEQIELRAKTVHKPVTEVPTTAKEKRKIMRQNVIQVLTKSTVMPFRWLKSSYRCFYCYNIFQEPSDLKNHQLTHIGDDIKEQAMNNYWESVVYVDVSNLSCKLCPEKIMDLHSLVDHLVVAHNVVFNKDVGLCMVAFKLDNVSVNCLVCGATFYSFGPLLCHTNKDHKGTSVILCDVCGQHFKGENLLRLHIKTVHENTGVLCTECGEKFDTRSKLKTHQKNQHEAAKKYKCLVCIQTFDSHYKRSAHMVAEHQNRKAIKCLHCPKTFVFRSMMMTHLRDAHLKVRNHICSICGWKAFNNNRLKNHMLKHSGEKNFKCEVCGKAFTTKKIMKAHFMRLHSDKPVQSQSMGYLISN